MAGDSIGRAVNLNKNEAGWVFCLLDNVEAGDARLLNAVAGVFARGGFECFLTRTIT